MSVLVRRFIIVTLICVNFAILFGALVTTGDMRTKRSSLGFPGMCAGPSAFCGAVL